MLLVVKNIKPIRAVGFFREITMAEAVEEIDFESFTREQLYDFAEEFKIEVDKSWYIEKLAEEIKKALKEIK